MFTFDQGGRRSWEVGVRPPPPLLRPWVEHLVVDRRPARERGAWRIVPDPSAHLLVSFGPSAGGLPSGDASSKAAAPLGPLIRATAVGARTRFVDGDVTVRGATVGVRFRPGGLAALTGAPARELTDRGASLDVAMGPSGRRIAEELAEVRSLEAAVEILVGRLTDLAARRPEPDWRIRAAGKALAAGGGRTGPGELARATGMAPRTLRAATADGLGLSPSRWVRIDRLFRALAAASMDPTPTWRWISVRSGYHDPAHLTREFRALLGETPSAWLGRRRRVATRQPPWAGPPK